MPTISQLPAVSDVTAADAIPVSQEGATRSVSIGALLASMQPAIINDTGTLLGRISLGPGGPEPIAIGAGLLLNDGTLVASVFDIGDLPEHTTLEPSDEVMLHSGGTSVRLPVASLRGLFSAGDNITISASGTIAATASSSGPTDPFHISSLVQTTSVAATDLVGISQGGMDCAISYANLLDGLTIDRATPAIPATDSDALWVAQGSATMLRQTFAAIWTWLMSKQPSYRLPVVELAVDTTLDGTTHNGRILICAQPITLSPAPLNMGSGFHCDVINLSGNNITFGSGIMTSSGSATMSSGQSATLRVITYSGGTVVFAAFGGSAGAETAVEAPGQVTGLTTNNVTTSSVALMWSAPGSGGAVSGYTVQFRVTGNATWSTFAGSVVSTGTAVSGLTASTSYEFQVYAVNAGGAGPASALAGATTLAPAGNVTAISWLMVPIGPYVHGSGSIGVNAQITPASAPVQFGFSTSPTAPPWAWVEATHVNTNLWGAYVSTPESPGTWYAWIEGTDGSLPTVYATPFTVT